MIVKVSPVVLGVAGVLVLSSAVALTIWGYAPSNPFNVLGLLLGFTYPMTKLAYFLLALQAIAVLVLGFKGLISAGRSNDPSPLAVLSLAAPGFGLAATLLGFLLILRAMASIHFSDLSVVAPNFAEALTPVGFGLLVGAIAAAFKTAMASRIT